MKGWLRRLVRILDQDRIRLPKRPLEPCDIRPNDRLQIGHEIWRVGDNRSPAISGGVDAFELVAEMASVPVAVLFAPAAFDGCRYQTWLLIKGAARLEVPEEMIVVFGCGLGLEGRRERKDS